VARPFAGSDSALPDYDPALHRRAASGGRLQNLGTDYLQLGDAAQARENFLLALNVNRGLVTVFAGLGELAGAMARDLSQSVVEHPTGEGYLQLGRVFQQDGRLPEARLAYGEALALNPALVGAQRELAALQEIPRQ